MPQRLAVVLGLALLLACASAPDPIEIRARIGGFVAPGFEEVAAEFERNFTERDELGAAVAAFYRGEKVVDLWGGYRDPDRRSPWREDTLVVVFSTTKGLAAMTLAVAHSRGWLDYDAPVARYWPEFAQNGKQDISVRQLLGHEAGLVLLDAELPVEKVADLDAVAELLARQRPRWEPGTRHGYHASTIGLYVNELLRRVDPRKRSIGPFFQEEIAAPLGAELYIGLPASVPDERRATLDLLSPASGLFNLGKLPGGMLGKVLWPWSLFNRSLSIPSGYDPNERAPSLEVELAAGNGVGTARGIARAYAEFAEGGTALQLSPATLEALFAAPADPPAGPRDEVLGFDTWYSLGFLKPSPRLEWGSSRRAIGSAGAGGSFAMADPDRRVGFAYVMNRMDFYASDDPARGRAAQGALPLHRPAGGDGLASRFRGPRRRRRLRGADRRREALKLRTLGFLLPQARPEARAKVGLGMDEVEKPAKGMSWRAKKPLPCRGRQERGLEGPCGNRDARRYRLAGAVAFLGANPRSRISASMLGSRPRNAR